MTNADRAFLIKRDDLQSLLDVLISRGYMPVGPTVREGAIVYDELRRVQDLPEGWTEDQDAGTYRLKRRYDKALFSFNTGPHSWKKYLFPPRTKVWEGEKLQDGGFTVKDAEDT